MSTPAATVALTAAEDAFVEAFRTGTLANDAFHHRDHVRMAWLYVRTHGPTHAVTRFIDDLRAFAAAKGVPRLYHATITTAYLTLVAERMAAGPDWPGRRSPPRTATCCSGSRRCSTATTRRTGCGATWRAASS